MTSDKIVKRLRDAADPGAAAQLAPLPLLMAAADEIERLIALGDMLVNSINYLAGDDELAEDLSELLACWEATSRG
jgi:hypothetical protein